MWSPSSFISVNVLAHLGQAFLLSVPKAGTGSGTPLPIEGWETFDAWMIGGCTRHVRSFSTTGSSGGSEVSGDRGMWPYVHVI